MENRRALSGARTNRYQQPTLQRVVDPRKLHDVRHAVVRQVAVRRGAPLENRHVVVRRAAVKRNCSLQKRICSLPTLSPLRDNVEVIDVVEHAARGYFGVGGHVVALGKVGQGPDAVLERKRKIGDMNNCSPCPHLGVQVTARGNSVLRGVIRGAVGPLQVAWEGGWVGNGRLIPHHNTPSLTRRCPVASCTDL